MNSGTTPSYRVCHKYLVAVELNTVFGDFEVILDFREIKNTGEGEGIVNVEVNPEQRIVLTGIKFVIEFDVIFISQLRGLLHPHRFESVYQCFAAVNGDGEETAILAQKGVDACLFKEFLAFIINVEHNVGSALGAGAFFHLKFGRTVAAPEHGFSAFLIAQRVDFNFLGYHECRVEAKAKVSDDARCSVFILGEEFFGARESYLVDILVDVLGGHTYAVVAYGEGAFFFVDRHCYFKLANFALEFAERRQGAYFLRSVYCV